MKVHSTCFGVSYRDGRPSHDVFLVKTGQKSIIAALADGAGSADAAREAAERAVRSLVDNYDTRPQTWTPCKALTEFTRLINRTLHQDSLVRFGEPELVTTLSVAVIEGNRLYGLNVGDSPIYLAREGRLTRLSRDHVATGPGLRHVLGRAVGLAADVEPHVFEIELRNGDLAMLCSDGVSNLLTESTLADKLQRRSAARTIVTTAKELAAGQPADDMSAIVLDIESTGPVRNHQGAALEWPGKLRKGQNVDGFTLNRQFETNDRVWLASKDEQIFVLKFAPVEARENEDLAHLFAKESWNASRLQDARFFPRAFVPREATLHYYAMEFIEAPTLRTSLSSRRLATDEAIALTKFLLASAQFLLRFDLVHGDLKPENILVIPDFNTLSFKLVDYGSVTELFSNTSRAGTASYLAPERFHEAPISERSEIFSIGVTLFESLTRTFPFGEIERFQTPRFHAAKKPTILNPNIPPWLEAVMLRALSPLAERRYQNYSEMLFELENPSRVVPFHAEGLPLLERDPLRFYKTGFYLLFALVITLLLLLLKR